MVFVSVQVHCPIPVDCEKRIEEVIQEVVSWTLDIPMSRVYTQITILDNELGDGEIKVHLVADNKVWNRIFDSRKETSEKLTQALSATIGGHFDQVLITTQSVYSTIFR